MLSCKLFRDILNYFPCSAYEVLFLDWKLNEEMKKKLMLLKRFNNSVKKLITNSNYQTRIKISPEFIEHMISNAGKNLEDLRLYYCSDFDSSKILGLLGDGRINNLKNLSLHDLDYITDQSVLEGLINGFKIWKIKQLDLTGAR